MDETYFLREQTAAKHFILRHYLQELALITLQGRFSTLTYVDGFSGPWMSRKTDFSDTSFMIAINVLKGVQKLLASRGLNPTIKCFFVEKDLNAFTQLQSAVMAFNDRGKAFHVEVFRGRFEDAIPPILKFSEGMTLTFIDPTGWTEYPFDKIANLIRRSASETLVNFMYDHISRFTSWDDEKITASFNGILRPNWRERIDKTLPPGEAAERLFRQEFKAAGEFDRVVSTPIKKLSDRTHFCITYGTRHKKGLEVYRDIEGRALRDHEFRRLQSNLAKGEATGQSWLFSATDLKPSIPVDEKSALERQAASAWLENRLKRFPLGELFGDLWPEMLERFVIRKTEAKDICKDLANRKIIAPSWKAKSSRRQKPDDMDLIALSSS
ncbi:three-Cys-motif partner protein TcmP [Rhizobium tumorigenes]|uniref:three-Cys-motif partner protein TcmP n=1 Tax=Rhizobium tumorigenes TaxID=2041385 RepID=UPI00241BED7F|nr:three-Cys-motif partner protein TcmP [Rhizobium tumorigenes]WFR99609.1 three-Cys-motif partner protein TcmP [Rhizobium tumorigenes]